MRTASTAGRGRFAVVQEFLPGAPGLLAFAPVKLAVVIGVEALPQFGAVRVAALPDLPQRLPDLGPLDRIEPAVGIAVEAGAHPGTRLVVFHARLPALVLAQVLAGDRAFGLVEFVVAIAIKALEQALAAGGFFRGQPVFDRGRLRRKERRGE